MSKRLVAAILLAWFFVPLAAKAQSGPVVVELYTSQGCSSCPPADAILRRLSDRQDVLPLALHVDYWDYIGWKDEYADPAHAKRQKGYAHAGGRKMIYTPQMIIMGQDDVVGADAMKVADLIAAHQKVQPVVEIFTERTGDRVTIQLGLLADPVSGPLSVQLVQYSSLRHAEITRGELAGHQLDYANVVESWQIIGQWNGQGPSELSASLEASDLAAAVLVQKSGHGPIVAAARID
jgi:hypothetical protein